MVALLFVAPTLVRGRLARHSTSLEALLAEEEAVEAAALSNVRGGEDAKTLAVAVVAAAINEADNDLGGDGAPWFLDSSASALRDTLVAADVKFGEKDAVVSNAKDERAPHSTWCDHDTIPWIRFHAEEHIHEVVRVVLSSFLGQLPWVFVLLGEIPRWDALQRDADQKEEALVTDGRKNTTSSFQEGR